MYGTLKWDCTDVDVNVKIVFDGLHIEDLSLIFEYEFINEVDTNFFEKDTIIKESAHRIFITKGVTRKIFVQAIVEIFAAAFKAAKE